MADSLPHPARPFRMHAASRCIWRSTPSAQSTHSAAAGEADRYRPRASRTLRSHSTTADRARFDASSGRTTEPTTRRPTGRWLPTGIAAARTSVACASSPGARRSAQRRRLARRSASGRTISSYASYRVGGGDAGNIEAETLMQRSGQCRRRRVARSRSLVGARYAADGSAAVRGTAAARRARRYGRCRQRAYEARHRASTRQ